jgi:uncharacterized protein (DUF1015 family)
VPEVLPFRALRYDATVVGDVGAALSPPFDVIDADEQRALHERAPYNVVRLELGDDRTGDGEKDNRYTRAAATLAEWRRAGALVQDGKASFYVYKHQFAHEGRKRRTVLFARVRLEPWEAGSVRPHELTGHAPKEDRLQLLRHLRTNVSPIWSLYRDRDGAIGRLLDGERAPLIETSPTDNERHTLAAISDTLQVERIAAALRERPLYIADGHHRYETALAYRDECRAAASDWTGDEPENFVMVALSAIEDPGLVLLPTHRLVRPPSMPRDIIERLEHYFRVDDVTPKSYDGIALHRMMARVTASGAQGTAFGALGLEEGRLHLLTLAGAEAARTLMPADHSDAWKALDVSVLEHAVLRETLGVTDDGSGSIAYTDDAQGALREVESGRWPLAFLLNATRVDQVLAIADADEKMPRKSTYFYPKIATGLVMNAFDGPSN